MGIKGFICRQCGKPAIRTGHSQRYCETCSEEKNIQRVDRASNHHGNRSPSKRARQIKVKEYGITVSRANRSALMNYRKDVCLIWQIMVAIPFDWAASKNHIFAMRRVGHIALRREAVDYKNAMILMIRRSLNGGSAHDPPIKVVQNKVWLDIFVQKPNNRGDAANFVDLICDAVKQAIGVDDRWFSIRHLDWEICKDNPRIFVGIGQETEVPVSICSACGRLLEFSKFQKNKHTPMGVARVCRECSTIGDAARQHERKAAIAPALG